MFEDFGSFRFQKQFRIQKPTEAILIPKHAPNLEQDDLRNFFNIKCFNYGCRNVQTYFINIFGVIVLNICQYLKMVADGHQDKSLFQKMVCTCLFVRKTFLKLTTTKVFIFYY